MKRTYEIRLSRADFESKVSMSSRGYEFSRKSGDTIKTSSQLKRISAHCILQQKFSP